MVDYTMAMLSDASKKSEFQKKVCNYFRLKAKDGVFDKVMNDKIQAAHMSPKLLSVLGLGQEELNSKYEQYTFGNYIWCEDRCNYKRAFNEVFNVVGKDGKFRSANYSMTWVYVNSDRLIICNYVINALTNTVNQKISQIKMSDVRSLSLKREQKVVLINKDKRQNGGVNFTSFAVNGEFSFTADRDSIKPLVEAIEKRLQKRTQD